MHQKTAISLAVAIACAAGSAQAAEWSDAYIGYRYGSQFHEPNNPNDVAKNILQIGYANTYSLGSNFLNLDVLKSNDKDPELNGTSGATEFYLTYRTQLQFGKAFAKDLSFGPVRDIALTGGFDLNTKNTAVAPEKRFLAIGPTLKFNVPGFLDVSLMVAKERNHNGLGRVSKDLTFDTQAMLSSSWLIPFQAGPLPMKFQGFINFLSSKGKDYNGVQTAPETLSRSSLMVDVGQMAFERKNSFWMGVGFEYWNNKFGNHNSDTMPRPTYRTTAPTLQAEFHF